MLPPPIRGIGILSIDLIRLFGDRVEIFWRALGLEEAHHILDFMVGHKGAVDAADAAARRHVQHVALAQQLLGALLAQDGATVDLSDVTWKEMRVGKLALMVPVITSTEGRCVAAIR